MGTDLGRAVRMPKVELVADAPEGTRLLRIQATQGTYVIPLPSTGETGGRLRLEPRSRKEEPYERPLAKTIQANAPGSVLSRRE